MASPTTVGSVGVGASAAGSILSAFGAYNTGQSNAAMYSYQAGMAQLNSKIALQNADYTRMQGEQQSVIEGIKGAQALGNVRAAGGASGLDVNTGSNADVQASQQKVTQLDMNQIRSNAAKTAYDYDVQSQQDTAQAGLYDMAASNSKTAGDIGALSSLVSGAGSVSSKWLQGSSTGLWSSKTGSGSYISDSAIY